MKLLSFLTFLMIGIASATADAASKIVFLGDSLTEGYNLAREQSYPYLVEAELKRRGHDVSCINAGVSGSTTASGLSRLKWQLKAAQKPEILVLALGANDGLRGLDVPSATKQLSEVMQFAKASGMKVVLAGMKMPPNYGPEFAKNFEKMFVELAQKEAATLIPFLLEGVAGEPSLNLADGIHPNAKGYEIIARTVVPYLEPLLSQASSKAKAPAPATSSGDKTK